MDYQEIEFRWMGGAFLCFGFILLILAYSSPNLKERPNKILLMLAMVCFVLAWTMI